MWRSFPEQKPSAWYFWRLRTSQYECHWCGFNASKPTDAKSNQIGCQTNGHNINGMKMKLA